MHPVLLRLSNRVAQESGNFAGMGEKINARRVLAWKPLENKIQFASYGKHTRRLH
jgi:hypothetical protein